jgi:hypothetical protein
VKSYSREAKELYGFRLLWHAPMFAARGGFFDDQIAAREATHGTLGRLGSLADIEIAALPFRIDP